MVAHSVLYTPRSLKSVFALIIFIIGSSFLLSSCAVFSRKTIILNSQPYQLYTQIGVQWEYWKYSGWPYSPGMDREDNLILEISESYKAPRRPIELDAIIDFGDETVTWQESSIKRLEVQPHYMTTRSIEQIVSTNRHWLIECIASIGEDSGSSNTIFWIKTNDAEKGDLTVIKPQVLSDGAYIANPRAIVYGDVYQVQPIGGTLMDDFATCYLANTSVGLVDLTIVVVSYSLEAYPFKHRRQEELNILVKPWPGWARRHKRSRNDSRLMVPGEYSGIWGWASSSWGWIVSALDMEVEVPAGSFSCTEITRFGNGYLDYKTGEYLYKEYWTPGIGLVARVDRRYRGSGIWVLAQYYLPDGN